MPNHVRGRNDYSKFPRGRGRLALLVLFLVCASLATAQLDTGTISGTVTDQSGAAVPGATITIRNVATGISRTTQSGPSGRYEGIALPAGSYEVSATLTGFQTLVRSGINLTVGRNAVVDMVLQVGEVTQAITVAGEASLVETTTATVTNLVNERKVLDIPLNNRDLTQLTYFQPGVLKFPRTVGGTRSQKNGFGEQLSIGGARPNQNVFLLDGVSNADMSGNPQGAGSGYTGAETVKEFQIITNNYSAEYPSQPGGILSAVTKSGDNSLHGSVYEFLRNDNLDAGRWEDNAFCDTRVNPNGCKGEFKRNNFGGSLGGPVLRDRTFFFVNYEGLRERTSTTETYIIPTAAGRSGNLGSRGTFPVNPIVEPYLRLYPLPGQGNSFIEDIGIGRARVAAPELQPTNQDFGTVKVDHQFSGEKAGFLAVTYNTESSNRNTTAILPSNDTRGYESRRHVLSARHTSILSPTALNEFTFGYSRVVPRGGIPSVPVEWANFNGVDLRFNQDLTNMGDFSPGDNINPVGYESDGDTWQTNLWTFKENFSLTRTNHTMKMGAEILRYQHPLFIQNGDDNGNYGFDDFQSFLAAKPNHFAITLPKGAMVLGEPHRAIYNFDIRYVNVGFFLQDNWKVTPSLTLNLGLRYEFMTVPSEKDGNTAALRSHAADRLTIGPLFENPTKRSFSPRIGFAWSPGDHRTSIRGGFGIYYDLPVLQKFSPNLGVTPPFLAVGSTEDEDAEAAGTTLRFPDALYTQAALLAGTPNVRFMEYNQKSAYVYRWSLTLEREYGPWVVSAGYTAARAQHLLIQSDSNSNRWIGWPDNVPPDQKHWTPTGGTAINPAFNQMWPQSPNVNSYYHGLTVNVARRLSAGLQVQGAYTLSKNVDQGSAITGADGTAQSQRESYYWDMGHKIGRSIMDIRNVFVSNVTYDLPRTALSGIGAALLHGWQVNGILTLSDGHAFSVNDSNTAQNNSIRRAAGIRPNLVPDGNTNPVLGTPSSGQARYYDVNQFIPSTCRAGVYCYEIVNNRPVGRPALGYQVGYFGNLGYGTLTGPGIATFDFSLNKTFQLPLSEEGRLQFRAEFFNLFNRANFSLPDSTPFLTNGNRDSQGGIITSTRGTARQIQFGLKFTF